MSKEACADIDYNYWHRVMAKMFPNYEFNPLLLTKPTTEFVVDVMEIFVNYFLNDFSKKIPKFKDSSEDTEHDNDEMDTPLPTKPWNLLAGYNNILRNFTSVPDPETFLFNISDIVCPNGETVRKITFLLASSTHLRNMDSTEEFDYIQKTLNERAAIPDYEQLIKKKMYFEVESACLQHKLDKLKSEEELERLSNDLVSESAKFEERKTQLKRQHDEAQLLLNQHEKDHLKMVESIKELEDKLVDENQVTSLKLDLDALKLKNKDLIEECENLVTKSANTKLTKELHTFQLNKLTDSEETLKQHENYRKVENEKATKLANNRRVNADLLNQIENYHKEIKSLSGDSKESDWKAEFEMKTSKIQTDLNAEEKKLFKLKSDAQRAEAQIEILLTEIDVKASKSEKLATNNQDIGTEAQNVMYTMLANTVKKIDNDF